MKKYILLFLFTWLASCEPVLSQTVGANQIKRDTTIRAVTGNKCGVDTNIIATKHDLDSLGVVSGARQQPAPIPNDSLAHSSVTVSAGIDLTGGGAVSLGSSTTLNADTSTGGTKLATQGFVTRQGYGTGSVTSVQLSGGTGITIGGTNPITTSGIISVTNTLPDQTVSLTQGIGIITSGTYPNFTIKSDTSDYATALQSGYLKYLDWTTFNNKQATVSVTTPITLTGASIGMVNVGTTTQVLHGNASGNASFGAIVNGDITNGAIDLTTKVTGLLPLANGGTNTNLSATGGTSKFLSQASTGSTITVVQPATTDLSDVTTWIDYSATATIVGWSAFTTKTYYYYVIGNSVTLTIYLDGTSNSTTTTVTTPFNVATGTGIIWVTYTVAGSVFAASRCFFSAANVIQFDRTIGGSAFTNTGVKTVGIQMTFTK